MDVAELTNTGQFKIAGNINTRLPAITDGLVAHWPFDGTDKGIMGNYQNVSQVITHNRTYYKLELLSAWGTGWHGINEIEGYISGVKQSLTGLKVSSQTYNGYDYENGITMNTGNYGGLNAFNGQFCTSGTSPSSGVQWLTPNDSTINSDIGNNYHYINPFPKPEWITWYSDSPLEEVWVYNGRYSDGRSDTTQYKDFILYISQDGNSWVQLAKGTMNQGGWLNGNENRIKIFSCPSQNSNNTLTYDGIAVEEATVNQISSPEFNTNSLGGNWGSWESSALTFDEVYVYDQKTTAVSITKRASGSTNAIHQARDGLSVGSNYTLSFYARIHPSFSETSGKIKAYINNYVDYPITKEWSRVVLTQAATATSNTIHITQYSSSYDVQVALVQFEAKPFATSFVNGSRGHGLFSYPSYNWNSDFTIMLDCKVSSIIGWRMPTGAWSTWYLAWLGDSADRIVVSWVDGTQKSLYSPTLQLDCREWNTIGFSYDSTNHIVRIYANGETVASGDANFSTAYPSYTAIGSLQDGSNSYKLNGIVKNYSVYNRVLSADEVKKLANPTFELTPSGDLITSSIKSQPSIPDDAIYFPLGFDAKDQYKVITPSSESNTVYEDGAVWIGQSTTNLLPYPDYSNRTYDNVYTASSWGGDAATVAYYKTGGFNNLPYKKLTKTAGGTGGSYLDDHVGFTIADNTTYVVSGYMKASRNISVNGYCLSLNRGSDNVYRTNGVGYNLTTEWQRFSWVYNSGTGHAGTYSIRSIVYDDDNLPLEVYWCGLQVEQKSYITPFINGTRNNTNLVYSPDFIDFNSGTICCWFYPTPGFFSGYTGDGWNRLFGHSTTVNTNLIQISKYASGNNLTFSITNNSAQPMGGSWTYCTSQSLVANTWYFVVIRWDITSGKMALFVNGVKNEKDWNATYQPTVKGSFSLGYHDTYNSRWSNSYYRDLMIFKRALTDDEVSSIYNSKMMVNNGLQLQSSIHTGVVI
jgi:hypothetical protein